MKHSLESPYDKPKFSRCYSLDNLQNVRKLKIVSKPEVKGITI